MQPGKQPPSSNAQRSTTPSKSTEMTFLRYLFLPYTIREQAREYGKKVDAVYAEIKPEFEQMEKEIEEMGQERERIRQERERTRQDRERTRQDRERTRQDREQTRQDREQTRQDREQTWREMTQDYSKMREEIQQDVRECEVKYKQHSKAASQLCKASIEELKRLALEEEVDEYTPRSMGPSK